MSHAVRPDAAVHDPAVIAAATGQDMQLSERWKIVRKQAAIDRVMDIAQRSQNADATLYHGMTYEDGILAMGRWLSGQQSDPPLGVG